MREADDARRQAGLAGNNAEASLRRALEEPRRYPPDQIAAAMAITAAARRLAGIAALIMQSPPVPEAMARIADMRPDLHAKFEDAADAIEHGRSLAASHVTAPPGHSWIEGSLLGALRQLSVATEAARSLAAREALSPSPHELKERSFS